MSATGGSHSVGCSSVDKTTGPQRGHEAVRTAPATEPAEPATMLDRTFGADDITVVRHAVQDSLIAAGFSGDRLQAFVLAVNEVITNVVLHAGGHGRVGLGPGKRPGNMGYPVAGCPARGATTLGPCSVFLLT